MNTLRVWIILSWIALPTVMYGGYSLLQLLNKGDVLTPFQVTWFRAGHAHAGVLLVMSLLYYTFLDRTSLSTAVKHAACAALFVGHPGAIGRLLSPHGHGTAEPGFDRHRRDRDRRHIAGLFHRGPGLRANHRALSENRSQTMSRRAIVVTCAVVGVALTVAFVGVEPRRPSPCGWRPTRRRCPAWTCSRRRRTPDASPVDTERFRRNNIIRENICECELAHTLERRTGLATITSVAYHAGEADDAARTCSRLFTRSPRDGSGESCGPRPLACRRAAPAQGPAEADRVRMGQPVCHPCSGHPSAGGRCHPDIGMSRGSLSARFRSHDRGEDDDLCGCSLPALASARNGGVDALTITVNPQHGVAVPQGRTGVVYRPLSGFRGEDAFWFSFDGPSNQNPGAAVVRVGVTVM